MSHQPLVLGEHGRNRQGPDNIGRQENLKGDDPLAAIALGRELGVDDEILKILIISARPEWTLLMDIYLG